ncbi:hypothetical protein GS682_04605 [Nostoc sp. B(2019)]|nr:hypothetical protein [Nostoc sp. B(2019)]
MTTRRVRQSPIVTEAAKTGAGLTTAPNLGKLFTGRDVRPATDEDIALLQVGDWISDRGCPWSYQFKRWNGDMCIGVWEGKEFLVPRHLLMVCEVMEGQVVEKFRRTSLTQNERTQQLKAGKPWDSPAVWSSVGVQCSYKEDLIFWGDKCFRIKPQIQDKYLNPRVLINFLEDSWQDLQCFLKYLHKCQPVTEKEIIDHFGCKKLLAKNAIALGVNSGILTKLRNGKYEISSQPFLEENFDRETQDPQQEFWRCKHGLHPTISPTDPRDDRFIRCDTLTTEEQICLCQQRIIQQNWRIQDLEAQPRQTRLIIGGIKSAKSAIADEEQRIDQLLDELIIYRQMLELGVSESESRYTILKLLS